MAAPSALPEDISPSSRTALRWAGALAAHREGRPPGVAPEQVEPADLLVGLALAHPDPDGEVRVLLSHFGLTARDVLPADYPEVSAADLRSRAQQAGANPPLGEGVSSLLADASALARDGQVHLRHVLGACLGSASPLRAGLQSGLASVGETVDGVESSYRQWLEAMPTGQRAVAGVALREWLRERNPRQPVSVATYCADRVDGRNDLIGIDAEADAFAYLIASRALQPPLAVGLFGDWGSGKSFLMRAVRTRVDDLSAMVRTSSQSDVPVWKDIKQVEFNAWEYVQGDLWAGLLERIFRELGSLRLPESLVEERRKPVIAKIEAAESLASAADAETQRLESERASQVARVARATEEAAAERERAEQVRRRVVEEEAREEVVRALAGLVSQRRLELVGRDGAALIHAVHEARAEVARGSALLSPYWRDRRHLLALSAAAFLVPLVALLLELTQAPALVSALGGLATVVPVVATAVRRATIWGRERLDELEAVERKVQDEVARRVAAEEQQVAEAEQRLVEAREALTELESRIASRKTEAESARRRAEELAAERDGLTPARVFVEFADERSDDYRRKLGLLSRVRDDLRTLERQVRQQNEREGSRATDVEHSVPNRIVLYVDDLDRCPPGKVVEVLEAVHLLLAFELFVVVVAVDSRWLSSALVDQLHALRDPRGRVDAPTPRDYLEKIFQLPFWVQPLGELARQQLMRGLLAPAVRGPDAAGDGGSAPVGLVAGDREEQALEAMLGSRGGAMRLESTPLALTSEDLRFLESLAPLLGETPRRVKRFVNTCQFLLAMRPPLGTTGQPSERQVVCLLAAVNEGLPGLADDLAAAIPSATTLDAFLREPGDGNEPERARLRQWVEAHPSWSALPLDRFAPRLDVARRLRFGHPGGAPRTPATAPHGVQRPATVPEQATAVVGRASQSGRR